MKRRLRLTERRSPSSVLRWANTNLSIQLARFSINLPVGSHIRVSRHGDKIAFFEHPLGDNSGSVMVVDIRTKEAKSLSTGWRALKGLAWSSSADALWFGGSKVSKKQNINAVSLSGQERLNVEQMPAYAKLEDISPQGSLLVTHGNTHSTMVIVSGDNSTSEPLGTRFAWSTSADMSSDGKTLLFYEWGWEPGEGAEVKTTYVRKFNDPNPVRLGEGKALALSSDGNWALAILRRIPNDLSASHSCGQVNKARSACRARAR